MFDGGHRRIVSMWFPRLATDRALRLRPLDGGGGTVGAGQGSGPLKGAGQGPLQGQTPPFVLTQRQANTERIHCLNAAAEAAGLYRGMTSTDARAFCPGLVSRPADPRGDARHLAVLARWATRYCPWVGLEGEDGLVMDITGAAHLAGGEAALLDDLGARMARAGLTVRLGLADTRGAAWALAHFAEGIAPPGGQGAALAPLPVAALRLDPEAVTGLERLGLRRVADLEATPRAPIARRFGPGVLARLDQALGRQPESVAPLPEPPRQAVRLTLPEPIGRVEDVMAGTGRLLEALCTRLLAREVGARRLCLTLRRVDRGHAQVELRLAAALRDPARILPLFQRGVEEVDAGFGLDQLRLEAVEVEPLPARQLTVRAGDPREAARSSARLDDLITRIGTRIGIENIHRFLPADSHIPERAFLTVPAAWSRPGGGWAPPRPRPVLMFPPEPILAEGPRPPGRFRWRRLTLTTARATGPERLTPEWWMQDEAWHRGLRDYWRVETREGRRLWLFHTPEAPAWFVQGDFG
ncbi:Y-family DNA polymerase [Acidimangrovimonas sediminis]|uniref:Y-family DNA polymerase n=1 Tax=Acidimangrovimonas sediminis TaxID=2056283 RepID=UPI000C80B6FE|nr:DNA polymerase Y family protein [Acidimangrovimonas sediminis]